MPDLIYVTRWPIKPLEWMECRLENGQLDGVVIRCPECNHHIRVYTTGSTIGQVSVMTISFEKLLSIAEIVTCPFNVTPGQKCTWRVRIWGSMVEHVTAERRPD